MPPKRKIITPPPKKSSKAKVGQTSIDNFFSSPSKPKSKPGTNNPDAKGGKKNGARSNSVISIDDSESDGDVKVARDLQAKFDNEAKPEPEPEVEFEVIEKKDKGKGRQSEPEEEDFDGDDGIEIVKEEVHVKEEGINGSSSSKVLAHVHPMFSSPERVSPPLRVKAERKVSPINTVKSENWNGNAAGSSAKITSTSAEPVEAVDFDVDQFLFRPGSVDVSKWPKGRLPYSVLVGVYVQVSSTRSRLLIVRVLTKYVSYSVSQAEY
jgi:hypothetical protein